MVEWARPAAHGPRLAASRAAGLCSRSAAVGGDGQRAATSDGWPADSDALPSCASGERRVRLTPNHEILRCLDEKVPEPRIKFG